MTKTIELARQSGLFSKDEAYNYERFAELVRADERQRLLAVAGDPVGCLFNDDPSVFVMPGSGFHWGSSPPSNAVDVTPVYTADQVAAAVLKSNEAPCDNCVHKGDVYDGECLSCRHFYASHFQSKG